MTVYTARRIVLGGASFLITLASPALADSAAWLGTTDGTWAGENWSANPVPGSADTATFNGAGNGNTNIDLGAGVTVNSILFDTGLAAGYTIGSGALGSQVLTLANGGAVTVNADVINNQLFNSALVLGNDGTAQTNTFTNNSAATLNFAAGISGSAGTGVKTLAIDGIGNTAISGIIANGTSGTVALNKSGVGTLTLTGNNGFTGGLSINGGIVSANSNTAIGATTNAVTLNGGMLRLSITTNAAVTNTHVMTVGTAGGTINVVNTSGTGTPTYIMGNAGNLTGSGALTVSSSGTLSFSTGADVLVLGNANTGYTGNVTLQEGAILEYGNANSLGTGATISVSNGSVLSISGVNSGRAVTIAGGGMLAFQNNNNGVISGAVTLNGDATVRLQDWYGATVRNGLISGAISGTGSLSVNSGTGTNGQLSVRSGNSYQGGTTVTNSTLAVDANNTAGTQTPFGSGTVTVNGNGTVGKVLLGAGSVTGVNNSQVTIANNFVLSNAFLYAQDQKQVLTGSISIASGGGILGSTYNAGGATEADKGLALMGVVSGSGPITIQQTRISTGNNFNTGFVIFGNNSNTYSGTITINQNTTATEGGVYLGVNASNALQSATVVTSPIVSTALRFGNSPIVFNTGLGSAAIGAISGSGNLVLTGYNQTTHAYGTDAIALTVGGNNSSTTYSGTISGIGNLVKSGNGAMTLSAANTFSGTTSVTAGTLVMTHGLSLQNSVVAPSSGIVFDASVAGNAFTFGGLTGSSNLTLVDNASNAVSLTFGNTSADYSGSIAASSAVTKAGGGTQTLSGSNSFTSGINLTGGTLALGSGGAIGASGNIVFGGGTLQYSSGNTTDYSARIASGTTSGAIAINTNGQTVTLGTGFTSTQSGGLSKTGSGTLVLTGSNSYTGTTSIVTGTLQYSAASAMSSTSALSISSGSTLALVSDSNTIFLPASMASQSGAISINITAGALSTGSNSTLTLGGATVGLQLTGDNTVNVSTSNGYTLAIPLLLLNQTANDNTIQTLNVASGSTLQVGTVTANDVNNRLAFSGAGNTVITGPITQAQANRGMGLVFNQSGTVTLSGTGTNLRNNTNGGSDKQVNLNSGTVNFNSSDAIRSTQGVTFNIAGGTVDNTSGNPVILNRIGTTNINASFAYGGTNDLDLGTNGFNLGSGTGAVRTITTNGSATLAIGGIIANGSTGTTLAKAGGGTLQLSAANTYTGGTSVTAGTLKTGTGGKLGTGNVTVTNRGTILELGNAVSIDDTAALVLGTGSTLALNFSNASESVASVQFGSQVFNLPTVFTVSDMHGVDSSYIQFTGSNASLTVVPEPASVAVLGLGAAGLLTRRRRRMA